MEAIFSPLEANGEIWRKDTKSSFDLEKAYEEYLEKSYNRC